MDTEATSRAFTTEEARREFLEGVWGLIRIHLYSSPESPTEAEIKRAEGLAHSFLVLLDGCSSGNPQYAVIPNPAKEDKYAESEGENYYEMAADTTGDISGCLHELFFKYK